MSESFLTSLQQQYQLHDDEVSSMPAHLKHEAEVIMERGVHLLRTCIEEDVRRGMNITKKHGVAEYSRVFPHSDGNRLMTVNSDWKSKTGNTGCSVTTVTSSSRRHIQVLMR